MSDDNSWNKLQGQTSDNSGGRSAEYADDLTVQDTTSGALDTAGGTGMSGGDTSGRTSPGAAMAGDNLYGSATTYGGGSGTGGGTSYETTTTGGVSNEPMRGGAALGAGAHVDSGSRREIGDNTDGLGRDQTDRVTADETGTLISADKVQGTAVYDGGGERLGTIDSLMLNKRSGKVAYAVMSFGGFLGIGERYHPLPWDKLTYDTDKGGYNVGATQDELRSGPTYTRDEINDFDGDRSRGVDDYYGRSALGGGITGATGIPIV